MRIIHEIILLLSCCTSLYSSEPETNEKPSQTFSLSRNLWPHHYILQLSVQFNPEESRFWAGAKIKVLSLKATNTILLNFSSLDILIAEITMVEVIENERYCLSIKSKSFIDDENEILIILMDQQLQAFGTYEVYMPFVVHSDSKLIQSYRGSFVDIGPQSTKWLPGNETHPINDHCTNTFSSNNSLTPKILGIFSSGPDGKNNSFNTCNELSSIILKMKIEANFKVLFWIIFLCFNINSFILADLSNPKPSNFRLPGDIFPESYDVIIYTNLNEDKFAFSGNVYVKVTCIQQTKKVILHRKGLKIIEEKVTVILDENNAIEIESQGYDEKVDFYIINLKTDLQPETSYFIYIPFEGTLGLEATGYYRSCYTDAKGNLRWISITMFDPIYARQAFPCWDDLPYKASFSISLAHDENLTALSNMELISRNSIDGMPGWVMSKFDASPPIPASNVAFVIGEFEKIMVELPPRNLKLRVWARTEVLQQTELALDTFSRALPIDEELFDMMYPLSKLDIVALPNFNTGYVSNFGFGLITESGILFDPKSGDEYNRRSLVSNVCTMLTQQWFNNIVTMKEWDGMWLGTGLVYYSIFSSIEPILSDWAFGFHTFANELMKVLRADSLKTSRSLQVVIESPDQIDKLYDTILFSKGPYILRMLSIILENKQFQLSVNNFLKTYKFGRADQFDLWKILTDATNVDIQGLMNPWTLTPGFPYLFVDVDFNQRTVTVSQERFLYDDKTEEEAAIRKKYCWPVALTYTTSISPNFEDFTVKQWLTCEGSITFPLDIGPNDWMIVNIGLLVPCRINYSKQNWDSILKTLFDENRFQQIEVRNRMQIVSDLFAFALVDILDYDFVFNAIIYLQYEIDYLPWGIALPSLRDIRSYFLRTELYEPIQAYVRLMLDPIYARLGPFGELPKDFYLSEFTYQMTFWSCEYGVKSCQQSSLETVRSWEAVPNPDEFNPIRADLRCFVYYFALKLGNVKVWEFLWERYRNAKQSFDKGLILAALGATPLRDKLQQLLEWSLDPDVFKPEDSVQVFLAVADNPLAYEMCVEFFMNRFQEIYKFLNGNPDLVGCYLPRLYYMTRTQQELQTLNNFVDTIRPQLVGTESSLNEAINRTNYVLAWIDKYKPVFSRIIHQFNLDSYISTGPTLIVEQ